MNSGARGRDGPGPASGYRIQLPIHRAVRREWVQAIHVARHIPNQPAFGPFNAGELAPGPDVETDEQIPGFVARDAEAAPHPACTCRMGLHDLAVADPSSMRVHGLGGLRVVDASAMP